MWKIRSAFLVKIANLNNKEHTLVQIARHRAGCLSICVQVFGDTLREVDGSPLLFVNASLLAGEEKSYKYQSEKNIG